VCGLTDILQQGLLHHALHTSLVSYRPSNISVIFHTAASWTDVKLLAQWCNCQCDKRKW